MLLIGIRSATVEGTHCTLPRVPIKIVVTAIPRLGFGRPLILTGELKYCLPINELK